MPVTIAARDVMAAAVVETAVMLRRITMAREATKITVQQSQLRQALLLPLLRHLLRGPPSTAFRTSVSRWREGTSPPPRYPRQEAFTLIRGISVLRYP